jgi:predicted porin
LTHFTLAALATLAATASFAQSTVELYGRAEVTGVLGNKTSTLTNYSNVVTTGGVVTTNTTGNGTGTVDLKTGTQKSIPTSKPLFRIDDGNRNGDGSSRFGFRGTEDLGGGLKAVFQFEAGVNVDDGSSGNGGGNLFSRTAMVGLDGGFGRLTAGRQVNPAFGAYAGTSAMGTMNGLSDAPAGLNLTTVRSSNSVMYTTPTYSGLTAKVLLGAPEGRTEENYYLADLISKKSEATTANVKPATHVNMSLGYANGPFAAQLGYESSKEVKTGSESFMPSKDYGNGISTDKFNVVTLGASYDLGLVKPFINYTTRKNSVTGNSYELENLITSTTSSNISNKQDLFSLGFTAPMGAGLLFAEMANGKTKAWTNTSTSTTGDKTDNTNELNGVSQSNKSDAFTIGYRHALSKRTWLQAAYGQSKNKVTYSLNDQEAGAGVTDITDVSTVTKNSGFALTLSHAF